MAKKPKNVVIPAKAGTPKASLKAIRIGFVVDGFRPSPESQIQ